MKGLCWYISDLYCMCSVILLCWVCYCFMLDFYFFFFFKQKTAYEMRISDWSSDVCSSDLVDRLGHEPAWHGDHRLLDELLQPVERGVGRVGVDRGDATGMAGIPCLQHVESFRSADLTDNDSVGPEPHG